MTKRDIILLVVLVLVFVLIFGASFLKRTEQIKKDNEPRREPRDGRH